MTTFNTFTFKKIYENYLDIIKKNCKIAIVFFLAPIFFWGCTWIVKKPIPPKLDDIQLKEKLSKSIQFPTFKNQSTDYFLQTSDIQNSKIDNSLTINLDIVPNKKKYDVLNNILCNVPSQTTTAPINIFSKYLIINFDNPSNKQYFLEKCIIKVTDNLRRKYLIYDDLENIMHNVQGKISAFYSSYLEGKHYNKLKEKGIEIIHNLNINDEQLPKHRENIFKNYKRKYEVYAYYHLFNYYAEYVNPIFYIRSIFQGVSPHVPLDTTLKPINVWINDKIKNNSDKYRLENDIEKQILDVTVSSKKTISKNCSDCIGKAINTINNTNYTFFTKQSTESSLISSNQCKKYILPLDFLLEINRPDKIKCKLFYIISNIRGHSTKVFRDEISVEFKRVSTN